MPDKETPEQVATTSADFTADRIERLQSLIPEAFTEGKIDFEKLKTALGDHVDDRAERYNFTWAGKRDAIKLLQSDSTATLRPVREESVDFDSTQNVFIEGDNLEVLKLLYSAYFGRIKMIYIDPPYNRKGDRIYKDNFSEPLENYYKQTGQKDEKGNLLVSNPDKSGRYHSTWLSMMYPRLFIARQLLTQDGLIFVSIDDNEAADLRLLMNEIFGEENFIGVMKRRAARKTAFLSGTMSDMCDYVLVYCKEDLQSPLSVEEISDETRPVFNRGNNVSKRTIPKESESRYPDGVYTEGEYTVRTLSFKMHNDLRIKDGKTQNDVVISGPFRINQKDLEKTVYITSNFGLRRYLREDEYGKAKTLTDLIDDPDLYNEKGTEEVEELLGGSYFDNPKPVGLLKFLIKAASTPTEKDFIVMDFFAGSSTTAQAVYELNQEDGGTRSFVLTQLPEPTDVGSAAYEVGYTNIALLGRDRIKRSSKKLNREGSDDDLGFRTLKLSESTFNQWEGIDIDPSPEEYAEQLEAFEDRLKPDAEPEDVIFEVALKEGYSLTIDVEQVDGLDDANVWRVTDPDKDQSFYICLDEELTLKVLEPLTLTEDNLFICRDSALSDTAAANLALQCRFKTL